MFIFYTADFLRARLLLSSKMSFLLQCCFSYPCHVKRCISLLLLLVQMYVKMVHKTAALQTLLFCTTDIDNCTNSVIAVVILSTLTTLGLGSNLKMC